MLKLMGAVLVCGACASLGLSARQGLRRRVAAADAMLLALHLIEGEIRSRRCSAPNTVRITAFPLSDSSPTISGTGGWDRRTACRSATTGARRCAKRATRPDWIRRHAISCARQRRGSAGTTRTSRSRGCSRSGGGLPLRGTRRRESCKTKATCTAPAA